MMKKTAWCVLLIFIWVFIASCVVSHPTVAPPPPKNEVKTPKPGPNYVWISGHWKWTGGNYVWVSGHWTRAKPGKVWVPGHWEKRGNHWVWISGHWR